MNHKVAALLIILSHCCGYAWGWNDDITHRALANNAAEHSKLSLADGDYLKNLGFEKGIEEPLIVNGKSKSIKDWIADGAVKEDAGTKTEALLGKARYLNHFHNPLKPWLDAGLSSAYNGESALLWSQDGGKQTFSVGGDWSWLTLRHFYYLALTSSTNTDRQAFFAQTFRGLGQQMHLVQDMAQPAHVRNDAHPADDSGYIPGFEYWAKQPTNEPIVKSRMANPIFPTVDAPITISRFYDTDQYDGTNPSTSLTLGLAEYTNANFFSEDTIFNSNFTYPSRTNMQYYEQPTGTTWMGMPLYRKYYKKTGGGEQIEHFAYLGRFYKFLDSTPVLQTVTLGLDNACYKDYAHQLLPRAVGYSAGLLNYFFRGQMGMYEDPQTQGTYIIENSSGEQMEEGTFRLFYDDEQGNRTEITGSDWSLYGQTKDLAASGDGSRIKGVTFTPPSPEPKDKKYMLVYYGKLGNEQGAVVGKVVDLNPVWEDWEKGLIGEHPWNLHPNPTAVSYFLASVIVDQDNPNNHILDGVATSGFSTSTFIWLSFLEVWGAPNVEETPVNLFKTPIIRFKARKVSGSGFNLRINAARELSWNANVRSFWFDITPSTEWNTYSFDLSQAIGDREWLLEVAFDNYNIPGPVHFQVDDIQFLPK